MANRYGINKNFLHLDPPNTIFTNAKSKYMWHEMHWNLVHTEMSVSKGEKEKSFEYHVSIIKVNRITKNLSNKFYVTSRNEILWIQCSTTQINSENVMVSVAHFAPQYNTTPHLTHINTLVSFVSCLDFNRWRLCQIISSEQKNKKKNTHTHSHIHTKKLIKNWSKINGNKKKVQNRERQREKKTNNGNECSTYRE